jgi:hypothetical protein
LRYKGGVRQPTNGIIQGWGPDGFGGFVYDFIDTEIQRAMSHDPKEEHWFFVYHPDTAWRVKFEKLLVLLQRARNWEDQKRDTQHVESYC